MASSAVPCESTTGWRVMRSVATLRLGISVSSKVSQVRLRITHGLTRLLVPHSEPESAESIIGKTVPRLSWCHSASSRPTPSASTARAQNTSLTAPTPEPTSIYGVALHVPSALAGSLLVLHRGCRCRRIRNPSYDVEPGARSILLRLAFAGGQMIQQTSDHGQMKPT